MVPNPLHGHHQRTSADAFTCTSSSHQEHFGQTYHTQSGTTHHPTKRSLMSSLPSTVEPPSSVYLLSDHHLLSNLSPEIMSDRCHLLPIPLRSALFIQGEGNYSLRLAWAKAPYWGKKGKKRCEKAKRRRRVKLADRWTFPSPDSPWARFSRRFCFAFFSTLSRSKRENPGSKVAFFPNCGACRSQAITYDHYGNTSGQV